MKGLHRCVCIGKKNVNVSVCKCIPEEGVYKCLCE